MTDEHETREAEHGARSKEEEVLAVASEYFLARGYQGASINAMARSSGISKESIYRYFSSKKALFEAVIERELNDYQERLRRLDMASSSAGLRPALLMAAEAIIGVMCADRTLALRRLIFDEATRSPDLGQHYYRVGPERAYARLEEIFAGSGIESEFGPAALARHFVALVSFQILLERECRVTGPLSHAAGAARVEPLVDDFIKAFVRRASPRDTAEVDSTGEAWAGEGVGPAGGESKTRPVAE
ncbi:MAG TPA: TetR/AcrR family transcriptional regulator [Gammaproteobacteria bacterium]|nr:TetR/AcrR family transcriptional regulator [Gammaproteobacteria bacterium]